MARLALARPLRERDFALLWTGMTISLVGDGVFLVATAWQVYDLSGSPTSLSLVTLSWSVGFVACVLLGGFAADRVERRRVMIAADSVRGLAVAAMGILAATGTVRIWHLAALGFAYGCAEGFFVPSFTALIPQIVADDDLVQANALEQVARPISEQLAGPAVGGVLVAAFGPATAYLIDAASFAVGIGCVAAIAPRALPPRELRGRFRAEMREGFTFVRSQPWLWATLVAAMIAVVCFIGPEQVLLPDLIRHDIGAGAGAYGLVLGLGGVGQVVAAAAMAQAGLPRRAVGAMYVAWALACLPIAGYGFASAVWQLAAFAIAVGGFSAIGDVIWPTLMQTRVPKELMGRVTSFDWLVSLALTPLSFGLAGPIASLVGTRATLIGAGIGASLAMAGIYVLVPALRSDRYERGDVVGEAGVADGGGVHPDDLDTLTRR